MKRIRTKSNWVILFTLVCLTTAPQIFAHAKVISTDPAPRSTLSRPPESINILFNQLFEPAYSSITVKRADGSVLTTEKAIVDPSNQKRLVLLLPVLPAGQYTVSYKVLSLDGHTISSTYSFRIKKEKPLAH